MCARRWFGMMESQSRVQDSEGFGFEGATFDELGYRWCNFEPSPKGWVCLGKFWDFCSWKIVLHTTLCVFVFRFVAIYSLLQYTRERSVLPAELYSYLVSLLHTSSVIHPVLIWQGQKCCVLDRIGCANKSVRRQLGVQSVWNALPKVSFVGGRGPFVYSTCKIDLLQNNHLLQYSQPTFSYSR